MRSKVVLLTRNTPGARMVYNHLCKQHEVAAVIMEQRESTSHFISRRIKKQGLFKVAGQLVFQIFVMRWLRWTSARRINEIIQLHRLDTAVIPQNLIEEVQSVNDFTCLETLKKHHADVVVVHGTRIISNNTLSAIPSKFINMHAGITPFYRGVHGMYWALVQNDSEHCGVTVHEVDAGIDTGRVLFQQKTTPEKKDNFITYPILQLAAGLPLLELAVSGKKDDQLKTTNEKGKLWYHPTILQYLKYRILKHVK